MKKVIHDDYRRRLINRVLSDEEISDVELLETLLFYVIPSCDVRRQAELLVERFGSAARVLDTDEKSLLNVNGIGNLSAESLVIMGKIMNKLKVKNEWDDTSEPESLFNLLDSLTYFRKYFQGAKSEFTVIAYLDEYGRPVHTALYTDNKKDSVKWPPFDCTDDIIKYKPNAAVMAHNHFYHAAPSYEDDTTTKRVMLMMDSHGVTLYDHIIICGNEHYSYFQMGRMEEFRQKLKMTMNNRP